MHLGFMSVELQGKSWYSVAKISIGSLLFCISVHFRRFLQHSTYFLLNVVTFLRVTEDSWLGMTSCFCAYNSIVEIPFFGVKVDGYVF